jgi:hypothetical protein
MKKINVAVVTICLLVLTVFTTSTTFAQRARPGWNAPLAQVGPGGESVTPIRDVVRRDSALLRSEILAARASGGDVIAAVQLGITRLLEDLQDALGMD